MPIHFFNEDIDFTLENQQQTASWLKSVIENHAHSLEELNYIFCSDNYLLNINKEFLDHNYFTDIITFDHSDIEKTIEGDIFISIDRVEENATEAETNFGNELHRVMVHGLLHLFGYKDKTNSEKKVMREKEDGCLSLLEE